jgi:hypothetical protein
MALKKAPARRTGQPWFDYSPVRIYRMDKIAGDDDALMMEVASTSETSVNFYQMHGATAQKTAIFILVAVRTSDLRCFFL